MTSNWLETRLEELIDIKHGFAFLGEYFRDEPPGDVLLTPGNFAIGGGFKADKLKFYNGSVPEDFILDEGDLLVTMTDLSKAADTLGFPAFIPQPPPACKYLHNQRLGKVVIKPSAPITKRFLYYLFCTREYRNEVLSSATGTTVKHTSPSRIKQFKFKRPPIDIQQAIAHILGILDDKIELNGRMKETLEAMAKALFKSWFVDFDPVHAKAEGRDTGLPKHIDDLFPDSFVDSEMGEIPKGWQIGSLGEVADVNWGDTNVTKASYTNTGYRAYSASGADGLLPYHDYDRIGVVLSAIGANAGLTWLTLGKWSCIKNTIRFWSKSSKVSTEYLYQETLGKDKWPLRGSAQPFISQGDARTLSILIPDNDLATFYGQIVRCFYDRIEYNTEQSHLLSTIRDTLLPKLISGELRIKDTERFIERAAI